MLRKRTKTTFFVHISITLFLVIIGMTSGTPKDSFGDTGRPGETGNIIFILDASGSMRGQINGEAKIDIAKRVLAGLINELPAGLNVGLVAYGHRRKGDCNDVEELSPLGTLHRQQLINKIKALKPKGKTPISKSVELTAEKLRSVEEETTIVLVSDGKETCGGDPCELVKKLKESGIRFVMHVIGFDVTAREKEQLDCIAKAGGGKYFTARNASEFSNAMKKVVEKPKFRVSVLKVTALKNGTPFQAYVRVFRQGENDHMAVGYTDPPSPFSLKLLPGVYDVWVQDGSVPDKPVVQLKGVNIEPGKTTEKVAEFTKEGLLKVTAIKAGKPFVAYVRVFRQGENDHLTVGYTDPPNPFSLKLLPGVYDIRVQDGSVPDKPVVQLKGINIEPGKTTEKVAEFAKEGLLKVTAIKAGKPFVAYVRVFRHGENDHMSVGYTDPPNPFSLKLLPGVYDIRVQDGSVPDKPVVQLKGINIEPGKTTEKVTEFTKEGLLKVTAIKAGKPFVAYVRVFRQEENDHMAVGYTDPPNPFSLKLLPGVYDIRVQDGSVPDKPVVQLKAVIIKSGVTENQVANF